ncbi:MAG: transmembrane anchor protein [Proteobacteria bacterium]|nr:transmembrane anchor protein [Pseudomonadota bacterium]
MYNTEKPRVEELPSTGRLIRSTVIAMVSAAVILLTIILPSEYGVDPTGIGRALGLAEMGEIKEQLKMEAEADRQRDAVPQTAGPDRQSNLFDSIVAALLIRPAAAQAAAPAWKDEVSITLVPGQGTEVKLVMKKGAVAEFDWSAAGGVANFDLHGDGDGNSISYEKGRGVSGDAGSLTAAFDGNHGWFWRNRTRQDITVTLRVKGAYTALKRM